MRDALRPINILRLWNGCWNPLQVIQFRCRSRVACLGRWKVSSFTVLESRWIHLRWSMYVSSPSWLEVVAEPTVGAQLRWTISPHKGRDTSDNPTSRRFLHSLSKYPSPHSYNITPSFQSRLKVTGHPHTQRQHTQTFLPPRLLPVSTQP